MEGRQPTTAFGSVVGQTAHILLHLCFHQEEAEEKDPGHVPGILSNVISLNHHESKYYYQLLFTEKETEI